MKRNIKRLPALLLAIILCLSLLPGTAWAANFPTKFYASVNYDYSSYSKSVIFGTVTQSSSGDLSYEGFGEKTDRVVYGMEYAGGVFYTVEGTKLNKNADDGFRELRMYNSDLTSYRTIGTVNQEGGGYWIVDTAMDLSGDELALYGTYNTVIPDVVAMSVICTIDLETATPGNYLQVTGLPNMHIIYAMAFDKEGKLYAIGADGGANGGPATLYTLDLKNASSGKVSATPVGEIKDSSDKQISTNWIQDLGFDHDKDTLYWAENDDNVLYTLNTESAEATSVGKLPTLQSFCIPYDAAFAGNKHMVSVICEGAGTVTSSEDEHPFYMVEDNGSITLTLTPDAGSGLRYVKVDGKNVSLDGLVENGYTFTDVTKNHVIEVGFKLAIPATKKTVTWLHYQGEPAKFYTVDNVYKFYDLPDRFEPDFDAPTTGYVQTLLDEEGKPIDDDEIILPGSYDVHVTHPGNADYAAMDVIYTDALVLGKCPGTPGRPVVYGKVGCKQGDLTTTSALQDYYGTNGELIDAAHDEIPVTLVWLNPETTYNTVGNFNASATIYAAQNLDQRLKDCYNLDDEGTPLTEGCLISARNPQVIVLSADEASLIKVQASDASGGTVSGKGVYKNDDQVTVTATANGNAGYEFKGWQENGSVVSTEATYTFNAEKDRTLTALFEVNEDYRVTLQADPQNGGTVTGGGSYEADNREATVTATANQGYYFIGWYKAGQEEAVNTNTEYTFTVPEDGITLTARFGVDYLTKAEQAKTNFESAVNTDAFEWQTLVQAVDAYEAAADFVENPPSGIDNASDRYAALTTYYNGIKKLDLSDQGIDNSDFAELYLFTGVTELNLSGNKGVTGLTALKDLTQLETLDISGTGVTTADVLVSGDALAFPGLKTLTAQNLSLTSLSALAELVNEEDFDPNDVTKWDFTGSTLTDTEDNKADVAAIQEKLGKEKFLPPTIQTTPDEPEIPDTPVNPGDGGVTTYAVTVEDAENGKVTRSPARAGRGTTVTITTAPDDGYELDKLTVTDARGSELELTDKGNGKYTFRMPASKVTVEAVFTEILPEPLPFIDVDEDAWYADAVRYVYEHDLMAGYGGDLFGPNDELSRAQFCQIIYNMEDPPAVTGSSAFTDVADGAWYANVVTWAAENGIVVGYGGGLFGPEDNITREQFAAILYRYAQAKGYGTTASFDLSAYGDVSDVSAWAISAMQWACGKDIIIGTSPTTLAPQGTATRAQAATMLQRFCEQYSQNEG